MSVWSVKGIKHPDYPKFGKVRVAEYPHRGDELQFFRQVNGKQVQRMVAEECGVESVTRADLGRTPAEQDAEARRLACQYIEKLVAPAKTPTTADTLTLAQLIDHYETDGFAGRTASYKRDALAALRRIGTFLGTDTALSAMKRSDLEKFYAHRAAQKHAPAGRGDLVALKIACRWAWRNKLLTTSPFTQPEFDKIIPPNGPRRRPIAKRERYDAIKAVAKKLPPEFEVLLDLSWETGKSHGGIRTLRWEHVVLTPSKSAPHGKVTWYADRAKDTTDTKKRRIHTRPLNANASAALQRWRTMTKGIGGFVFPSLGDPNKPLTYDTTKEWMRKAENLAKVPHFKQGVWHPYRRGWTWARKDKFSPAELAAANDWLDPSMVVLYQSEDEESTLEAATYIA